MIYLIWIFWFFNSGYHQFYSYGCIFWCSQKMPSLSRGSADRFAFNLCPCGCLPVWLLTIPSNHHSVVTSALTDSCCHIFVCQKTEVWKPTTSLEFPQGSNGRIPLQADGYLNDFMCVSSWRCYHFLVNTLANTFMHAEIKSQYNRQKQCMVLQQAS